MPNEKGIKILNCFSSNRRINHTFTQPNLLHVTTEISVNRIRWPTLFSIGWSFLSLNSFSIQNHLQFTSTYHRINGTVFFSFFSQLLQNCRTDWDSSVVCTVHGTHHLRVRNCDPTHAYWVKSIASPYWNRSYFPWTHYRRYLNLHINGLI